MIKELIDEWSDEKEKKMSKEEFRIFLNILVFDVLLWREIISFVKIWIEPAALLTRYLNFLVVCLVLFFWARILARLFCFCSRCRKKLRTSCSSASSYSMCVLYSLIRDRGTPKRFSQKWKKNQQNFIDS